MGRCMRQSVRSTTLLLDGAWVHDGDAMERRMSNEFSSTIWRKIGNSGKGNRKISLTLLRKFRTLSPT